MTAAGAIILSSNVEVLPLVMVLPNIVVAVIVNECVPASVLSALFTVSSRFPVLLTASASAVDIPTEYLKTHPSAVVDVNSGQVITYVFKPSSEISGAETTEEGVTVPGGSHGMVVNCILAIAPDI